MAASDLPERVKTFLFSHVDSAEQLEILLLLSADRARAWTARALSDELRSTPNSVTQRLAALQALGLVSRNETEFRYDPRDPDMESTVAELVTAYRVQRHRVLGIIFSPLKKARDFADAFQVAPGAKGKNEDHDG